MQKNANSIYDAFIEKKISKKAAVDKILVFIFKNKNFYGLQTMEEDNFNELLLNLIPIIEMSFSKYSKTQSSYSTFLQSIVRRTKSNFERKLCMKKSNQKYLYFCAKNDYYNEFNADICCDTDYFENKLVTHTFSNKQILVIALKCAYYLDDEKIEKIALKTGYNERYIWSLKKIIDEEMRKQYEKNLKRIQSINKSFYLKQKAAINASYFSKDNEVYERSRYLENFHTERWQKKTSEINYRFVVPTNNFIAEILGEKETYIANAVVKSKKYAKNLGL